VERIDRIIRIAGAATVGVLVAAAYLALVATPAERVMGDAVRILYVHVGAAWTAYLAYAVTAVGAVAFLWHGRPAWDRLALASAEWGVVLTTVTLATGMLWGRAAQGWWWRWDDPRLTLTLMLWFLYAGYLILRQYTEGVRRARAAAVVAVAGVPAMVLNHFVVILFPAFHPEPVAVRPEGPALSGPFIAALALSLVGYTLVYVTLLLARMRLEQRREALAACARVG
jgi:heme exporter protein C